VGLTPLLRFSSAVFFWVSMYALDVEIERLVDHRAGRGTLAVLRIEREPACLRVPLN
jgi:hypothetical protein